MSENEKDFLDSLMESLSEDEEIEKKIDTFARNKERSERIARAREASAQFQETYSKNAKEKKSPAEPEKQQPVIITSPENEPASSSEDEIEKTIAMGKPVQEDGQKTGDGTIVLNPGTISAASNPGGSTRVFDQTEPESKSSGEGTVSVSENEIKELLHNDQPILSREYLDDGGEPEEDFDNFPVHKPQRPRTDSKKSSGSWKKPVLIGCVLAAVALAGTGGWLVYSSISRHAQQTPSANFDRLLAFAQDFAGLSEDEKKKITDYKAIYDKLSEDEKRKINEALMASTGKSFDELLADAQAQNKPQSSNSNMANAERKAQLMDQMNSLRGEIDQLNTQLESTRQRISDAETDYNNKNSAYLEAQAQADAASAAMNDYNAKSQELSSEISSLQGQIAQIQSQISALPKDSDKDDSDDSSEQNPSNPPASSSGQRAQLEAQLKDLRNQLASKQSELDNLRAPADPSNLVQAAVSAKQAADTAYGAWQAIINDADPISAQIDQKNAQLAALQNEYNSID